jgi:hypothetical protein
VKEFGVYAVYNYSGVDRDGITSFAASEDLERVVKVIDIALEYANDNYEADVLPGDSADRRRAHGLTVIGRRDLRGCADRRRVEYPRASPEPA